MTTLLLTLIALLLCVTGYYWAQARASRRALVDAERELAVSADEMNVQSLAAYRGELAAASLRKKLRLNHCDVCGSGHN